MAMASKDRVSGNLVDLEHGLISREIFVNDELYQRELEQVFARSWLFIGHESQVVIYHGPVVVMRGLKY